MFKRLVTTAIPSRFSLYRFVHVSFYLSFTYLDIVPCLKTRNWVRNYWWYLLCGFSIWNIQAFLLDLFISLNISSLRKQMVALYFTLCWCVVFFFFLFMIIDLVKYWKIFIHIEDETRLPLRFGLEFWRWCLIVLWPERGWWRVEGGMGTRVWGWWGPIFIIYINQK